MTESQGRARDVKGLAVERTLMVACTVGNTCFSGKANARPLSQTSSFFCKSTCPVGLLFQNHPSQLLAS